MTGKEFRDYWKEKNCEVQWSQGFGFYCDVILPDDTRFRFTIGEVVEITPQGLDKIYVNTLFGMA
jgi:hypothetical protein